MASIPCFNEVRLLSESFDCNSPGWNEDPNFGAGYLELGPGYACDDWRRLDGAALYEGGINPNDIEQGALPDCYFLASIGALACKPSRISDILIDGGNGHCYGVKWYANGHPQVTWVDDRFPYSGGKPKFSHNKGNEKWVMILEKAYAKVHGSYSKIGWGNPSDALSDLTGKPSTIVSITYNSSSFVWNKIVTHCTGEQLIMCASVQGSPFRRFLLMGLERYINRLQHILCYVCCKICAHCPPLICCIWQLIRCCYITCYNAFWFLMGLIDAVTCGFFSTVHTLLCVWFIGLVPGHAYSVLAVKEVYVLGCIPVYLVQVRNPWGKTEYKGLWSDKSWMWSLCPTVKKQCGQGSAVDDGSFWMSFSAFCSYFDRVDVLHLHDNWSQTRLACKMLERQAELFLSVDEPCALRVSVVQQRKDPRDRFPWKMWLVHCSAADRPVGGEIPLDFSTECQLTTDEINAKPGKYLVKFDGMRQNLPVDIVCAAYSSKPVVRWMLNAEQQV